MSLNNIYKFLRILINNTNTKDDSTDSNQIGITTANDIDYPQLLEDLDRHSNYLWLLVIDLLIFIGLTVICYSSSKKLIQKTGAANSIADDFKPKFVKGLVYANGVRAISLIFIIVLENRSGNNPASWLNYICHTVPAFVFVSAYMYLVTFLADLYYTSIEYNNHLAKPALLLVCVSAYIILALMALITFAAQLFKAFAYSSEFLMAVVYCVLGTMIVYYGNKISNLFAIKNYRANDSNNDIGQKLQILSLSVGGLFLLKSLCGLLTAFHFFDDFYPVSIGANIWDFLWFLITEIAPTVVFIFIARKKENTRTSEPIELNEKQDDFGYTPPRSTRK